MTKQIMAAGFACIGLFLFSCGNNNTKIDKNEQDSLKTELNIIKDSTRLFFSGLNWNIIQENEISEANNFVFSKLKNVFTDDKGKLHLKISNIDGSWYGAEIQTDTLLGFGTYTFYIDAPVDKIDIYSELDLAIKNIDPADRNGMTETGVRFNYGGDKDNNNCMEYYLYSTNRKFAGVSSADGAFKLNNSQSIFKITIARNEYKYESFEIDANGKMMPIYSFKLDKSSKLDKNSDIDELVYAKSSSELKPILRFYLDNAASPFSKMEQEIIISKFEFIKENADITKN